MRLKAVKTVPFAIAAAVIGLVALLQYLSFRFASPAGEARPGPGTAKQAFYFDAINKLEWMSYDWRVRLARDAGGQSLANATNLGFVQCTDKTIAILAEGALGAGFRCGLLWPRHLYGWVVNELVAQGAKGVAFDVMFGERRPDQGRARSSDGTQLAVSSDTFFAQACAEAGNVILAATPEVVPPPTFLTNAWAMGDIVSERDADGILRRARLFREYRVWLPELLSLARLERLDLNHAQIAGGILTAPPAKDNEEQKPATFALDGDGQLDLKPVYEALGRELDPSQPQRARPFVERLVWHLGVELAARELDLDLKRTEVDLAHGRLVFHGTNGLTRAVPVDRDGFLYIDWRLPFTDRRLTARPMEVLLSQSIERQPGGTNAPPPIWKDKLVVIGSTATGGNLTDLGATPLENETPLLSKHWNVANSVIINQFVQRAPYWLELLLVMVLGAASGVLTWRLRALWASVWVAITLAAYCLAAVWLFVRYRYWLPLVLPVGGAMLMTHVGMITYRAVFEQAERRRVKSIFQKMVSPDVVNEVLGQEHLALGGARRRVTIFFSDVRGFTQMTDENQRKAEELVRRKGLTGAAAEAVQDESARETLATVNLFLATISDTVKRHRGTLDKYIGDCVMAFWGAPIPNDRHAAACVHTAIDSQRAMHALNQQRMEENKRREAENVTRVAAGLEPLAPLALLSLGTGINTGVVIVGMMGSDVHILNYTAFGREVNVASRLEGVSGRGRIIISAATHAELQREEPALAAECVPLGGTHVKGISEEVQIYEVPWREDGVITPPGQTDMILAPPSRKT